MGKLELGPAVKFKHLNRLSKSCQVISDYVYELTPQAKFGVNPLTGSSGQIGEMQLSWELGLLIYFFCEACAEVRIRR